MANHIESENPDKAVGWKPVRHGVSLDDTASRQLRGYGIIESFHEGREGGVATSGGPLPQAEAGRT